MNEPKQQDKPFQISKWKVWEAFERVKANKGAAGVDEQSIAEFEADRDRNLYQDLEPDVVGLVFPAAGESGGDPQGRRQRGSGARRADRGRPGRPDGGAGCIWSRRWSRSSIRTPTATGRASPRWTRSAACRQRCWRADWVIDLDIRAFFDTVPWDLVLKAVAHHISPDQRWILLYVRAVA